jgi:cellulose synthase (UDP-forming)
MAQILRTDCPLFKRGLSLAQRLNYFNAMLHFFFGFPRIIMVLAPLTYLLFGAHPIKADVLAVIAYILPHIGLSTIANSIISKNFRHSFWAGVYEISIAPYTALATLTAMLRPSAGAFNVTDKGTNLDRATYDVRTSAMTLVLAGLTLVALMIGFPLRVAAFGLYSQDPTELDSILINSLWALANLVTLVAAACVGIEQPQQRQTPRVRRDFECEILAGDDRIQGRTIDLSEGGVRMLLNRASAVPDRCSIWIQAADGASVLLQARRAWCDWSGSGRVQAAFVFDQPDAAANEALVRIIFTGDQSWTEQVYAKDRVLHSLWYLSTTLWRATRIRRKTTQQAPEISGQWRAWYGDIACECVSISAMGCVVRIPQHSEFTPEPRMRFRIELDSFSHVEAEASLSASEGDSMVLEFHWLDFSSMKAFSSAIYNHTTAHRARPRKPFWTKWAEDLR